MADPYLEGDSAPVRTDHTAVDLAVTGTTPEGADALCEVGVGGLLISGVVRSRRPAR